ncbi:MAG: GNAT family N-acetyltransferase [Anaerolineae bacterium]|nr:GNAT family N-acetyltransferase [Anaerolineae bacterium]
MPHAEVKVADGLILHSVRNEADVARFVALSAAVTDEGVICDRLLHHHPETDYDDYFLVVDENTGEAVSTTCLIPWVCNYEGVTLRTAMLEMVVTHPDYRRRGLVRTQVDRFHQTVGERGYDLSIIQGIPYYYRQYGYAYALDHTRLESLPAWRAPDGANANAFTLRPATPDDVDSLTELHQLAMAEHQVYVRRTPEYWRYLLQQVAHRYRLVEEVSTNRAVGYVCVSLRGQHLRIDEDGITGYDVGWAVLRQLKTETTGEIQVVGSSASVLARLARSLGSRSPPCDQWLLRLHNITGFLSRIGPVLEQRLTQSGCAGLTTEICLNFFRQAVMLCFEEGKLREVRSAGFVDTSMGADGGDLCIPPDAFVRLVFGYRTLEELQDAWPDIRMKPERRYVLDALFPRLRSHILMPY